MAASKPYISSMNECNLDSCCGGEIQVFVNGFQDLLE